MSWNSRPADFSQAADQRILGKPLVHFGLFFKLGEFGVEHPLARLAQRQKLSRCPPGLLDRRRLQRLAKLPALQREGGLIFNVKDRIGPHQHRILPAPEGLALFHERALERMKGLMDRGPQNQAGRHRRIDAHE